MLWFQIHKLLVEWLDDIDQKIQSDDSLMNDLSEKKAKLEKFKTFNRDIDSHNDLVKKLTEKLQEDGSLKSKEIEDTLKRYDNIRKTVNEMIAVSINYVKNITLVMKSYNNSNFIISYRNWRTTLILTFSTKNRMITSTIGYAIAR